MVLLFTWQLVRPVTRVLLVLYILAMTFTLTYGGEHYVVDAFLGWAYAAAAVYGVAWAFRRRSVSPAADDAMVVQELVHGPEAGDAPVTRRAAR